MALANEHIPLALLSVQFFHSDNQPASSKLGSISIPPIDDSDVALNRPVPGGAYPRVVWPREPWKETIGNTEKMFVRLPSQMT